MAKKLTPAEVQKKFRGSPHVKEMDSTPVEMPVGYSHPPSLQDMVAKMVRHAVVEERGEDFETIEEADDLEVEDDELLLNFSDYEIDDLTEEQPITELTAEPDPPEAPPPEAEPPAPQEPDREDPVKSDTPGETG